MATIVEQRRHTCGAGSSAATAQQRGAAPYGEHARPGRMLPFKSACWQRRAMPREGDVSERAGVLAPARGSHGAARTAALMLAFKVASPGELACRRRIERAVRRAGGEGCSGRGTRCSARSPGRRVNLIASSVGGASMVVNRRTAAERTRSRRDRRLAIVSVTHSLGVSHISGRGARSGAPSRTPSIGIARIGGLQLPWVGPRAVEGSCCAASPASGASPASWYR